VKKRKFLGGKIDIYFGIVAFEDFVLLFLDKFEDCYTQLFKRKK